MLYDPDRVGGLHATHGLSGVRRDAPGPQGDVEGTDGGDNDRLALLAVNDIQEFWAATYPSFSRANTRPCLDRSVLRLDKPVQPRACAAEPSSTRIANASYCRRDDSISWDRGVLIPNARKYFGDIAVAGVLAHELGHAVQTRAHSVHRLSRTIVKEQQADCFAGVYLHWVAQGRSTRFAMNTTDGLDHVLAGGITLRDPTDESENAPGAHGSALDRVGAFQEGFDGDAATCAAIDKKEIARRHVGLPPALQDYSSQRLRARRNAHHRRLVGAVDGNPHPDLPSR